MSNQTKKHNKKEEAKKMAVRVVCIALAALMALSAFVGLLMQLVQPSVHFH